MSIGDLAPLAVATPLGVAVVLIVVGEKLPSGVVDAVATATAAASATMCALLLAASWNGTIVRWFGGWQPRGGVALGIDFAVDPFGAGIATFVAVLVVAALFFSWHYFARGGPSFYVLMLVFLAAMLGFALTGDLFNMFVWFELMGVAAFALTGYRIEDQSAVEGAFSFAVVNSIAAFLVLISIAILYGSTGALNMAQLGHSLAEHATPNLLVVAFVLIVVGFGTKAALAPFHFWLSDAHAVAPTPLCLLFSGIMVQLGLYAIARLYWTIFAGALGPHEAAIRTVLLSFGVLTAVVGAVMCFAERHLKRLLAFSTISHSGLLLIGVALFSAKALAGFWIYVFGHGFVKGALFLSSGIVLQRFSSVDINDLAGRGRKLPITSAALVIGALGLAALPPFGTYLGKSLIEDAGHDAGLGWITLVLLFVSGVTGGSVLRAAIRIYTGWGQQQGLGSGTPAREIREQDAPPDAPRWPMLVPVYGLLAAGVWLGSSPLVATRALTAALRFEQRSAYVQTVLGAKPARSADGRARSSGGERDHHGSIVDCRCAGAGGDRIIVRSLPRPAAAGSDRRRGADGHAARTP